MKSWKQEAVACVERMVALGYKLCGETPTEFVDRLGKCDELPYGMTLQDFQWMEQRWIKKWA